MIVVDACIAVAWVLDDVCGTDVEAALDYIGDHGGCVPGNFHTEVAHALLQAERRKRIDAADVAVALNDILSMRLSVEQPDPHVVISTARKYGLSCYDGAYLALALERELSLATADAALRRASIAAKRLWQGQKRPSRGSGRR